VIDLHCHLLPGIDDGPRSMSDAVTMARAAVAAGTTAMVCTPHMHPRFPTRPATVLAGVAALAERLREEDVPLQVYAGGEIALGHLLKMSDADLAMACLGSGSWLLLEMPFRGWPLGLAETVRDLEIRGYRVVLAHPERAESIQRTPDRLRDIVGRGALVQITAESLTGDNGTAARRTAQVLLAGGPRTSSPRTPTRPGRGGRPGSRPGSRPPRSRCASSRRRSAGWSTRVPRRSSGGGR